jgi:hypothetical protein
MKQLLTTLMFVCAVMVHAQQVTLAWDASPSPGIANYRIYFGTSSRNYSFVTNAGLALTLVVKLPHTGRWFFAATAVATNGLESDFSAEVEWEARPAPPVPRAEALVRLSPVIERSTNGVNWVSTTGAPTFFAATNETEVFVTRRLLIERVQQVNEP